jgi:hypothetical protein
VKRDSVVQEGKGEALRVDRGLARARVVLVGGRLLLGLLWGGAGCAGFWLLLFGFDNAAQLPAALRLFLSIIGLVLSGLLLCRPLGGLFRILDLDATALILERRFGIARNALVNARQLGRRRFHGHTEVFARRAVECGEHALAQIRFHELIESRRLLQRTAVFVVAAGLWGVYAVALQGQMLNAARRYATPLADIPPLGRAVITVEPSERITVAEGEDLAIVATVTVPPGKTAMPIRRQLAPHVAFLTGTGPAPSRVDPVQGMAMQAAGETAGGGLLFKVVIRQVKRPFHFRVVDAAANTYSRDVAVNVRRLPRVSAGQVTITPPSYTHAEPETVARPPGSFAALPGSRLQMDVVLDGPADGLAWESPDGALAFVRHGEGWRLSTGFEQAGVYRIKLVGDDFPGSPVLAGGGLSAQLDRPPRVTLTAGRRDVLVAPGEKLVLDVGADDDFGIADIALVSRTVGGEERQLDSWTFGPAPGQRDPFTRRVVLTMYPSEFPPDSTHVLEAVCRDFRPGALSVRSAPVRVRVDSLDPPPITMDPALRRALSALQLAIAEQQQALAVTRDMIRYMDDMVGTGIPSEVAPRYTFGSHYAKLNSHQSAVGSHLAEVIKRCAASSSGAALGQRIESIHRGAAEQAVRLVDQLGDVERWVERDAPAPARGRFGAAPSEQTVRFPECRGRFAVVAFAPTAAKSVWSLSDLEFLASDGEPFPRRYVQCWHLWETTDSGDSLPDETDRLDIIQKALERPATCSAGMVVTPTTVETGTWYAVRLIQVDHERSATLSIGGNGMVRAWLNGWLVAEVPPGRGASADKEQADVTLRSGANELLVQVSGAERPLTFSLRILDSEGAALGLTRGGRLESVPNWRVAYGRWGNDTHPPDWAMDGRSDTSWESPGPPPHGLVIDFGETVALTGCRGVPESDKVLSADVTLRVLPSLAASRNLPGPLAVLEDLQTYVLNMLVASRGSTSRGRGGSAAAKDAAVGDLPAGAPGQAVHEAAATFAAEVRQFGEKSRNVSQERDAIINEKAETTESDADALEALKRRDRLLAGALEDALAEAAAARDAQENKNDTTGDQGFREMLSKGGELAEAAKEKAECPANQSTPSLDDTISNLCDDILQQSANMQPPALGDTSMGESRPGTKDEGGQGGTDTMPMPMDPRAAGFAEKQEELRRKISAFEGMAADLSRDEDGVVAPGPLAAQFGERSDGTAEAPPALGNAAVEDDPLEPADGRVVGNMTPDSPDRRAPIDSRPGEDMESDRDKTPGEPAGAGYGRATTTASDGVAPGDVSTDWSELLQRIGDEQVRIRETAQRALYRLAVRGAPPDTLEHAVRAMRRVEDAARRGDPVALRRACDEAASLANAARQPPAEGAELRDRRGREGAGAAQGDYGAGRAVAPAGYEEMVGAYFRELARGGRE